MGGTEIVSKVAQEWLVIFLVKNYIGAAVAAVAHISVLVTLLEVSEAVVAVQVTILVLTEALPHVTGKVVDKLLIVATAAQQTVHKVTELLADGKAELIPVAGAAADVTDTLAAVLV